MYIKTPCWVGVKQPDGKYKPAYLEEYFEYASDNPEILAGTDRNTKEECKKAIWRTIFSHKDYFKENIVPLFVEAIKANGLSTKGQKSIFEVFTDTMSVGTFLTWVHNSELEMKIEFVPKRKDDYFK